MRDVLEKFGDAYDKTMEEFILWITEHGLKILLAIIILFVGFRLIKVLLKLLTKAFLKSKLELSLSKFLISLTSLFVKVGFVVLVIHKLVMDITPLLAIGAAAGIGVGLALQGSLANFMGGILILILRPFVIGDYIFEKAFGNEGTVENIQVFYTTLLTRDNKTVIIPNGLLSNNSVTNYTAAKFRRVDLMFSAAYSEDIRKVKNALEEVLNENPLVCKDKENFVGIGELATSSVEFIVWAWCEACNYNMVKYDLIEKVRLKFLEQNIEIPFPQMEVSLKQNL